MAAKGGTPDWDQPGAESWAAVWAGNHDGVAKDHSADEALKEKLRAWMQAKGVTELIDGETGLGVRLGTPQRQVTWDTNSMPDALLLALKARGLVDIRTALFEQSLERAPGVDLMEAIRFRMVGEKAPPLVAMVPDAEA